MPMHVMMRCWTLLCGARNFLLLATPIFLTIEISHYINDADYHSKCFLAVLYTALGPAVDAVPLSVFPPRWTRSDCQ